MATNGHVMLSTKDLVRYAQIGLEIEQQRIAEAKEILARYGTGEPARQTEVVTAPVKRGRGNGARLAAYAKSTKGRKRQSEIMKARWAAIKAAEGKRLTAGR